MNTNTIEIVTIAAEIRTDSSKHDEAIRLLADTELFLVGGGTGEVSWNTPAK